MAPTVPMVRSSMSLMFVWPSTVFWKITVATAVSRAFAEPIPCFAVRVMFTAVMLVRDAASPSIAPPAAVSVASPPSVSIDPAAPNTMSSPVVRFTSVDEARVIASLTLIAPLNELPMSRRLAVMLSSSATVSPSVPAASAPPRSMSVPSVCCLRTTV